jgi:hypothetical protein
MMQPGQWNMQPGQMTPMQPGQMGMGTPSPQPQAGADGQPAEVMVASAPPAEQVEVVPPDNERVIWIKGHWHWDNFRWQWIHGHYEERRVGHTWIPAQYVERGGIWHYVPGHWRRAL